MIVASLKGEEYHTEKYYCTVQEVMEIVGCKRRKAYQIISSLRNELVTSGKLTPEYPHGRVPRKYLQERLMVQEVKT